MRILPTLTLTALVASFALIEASASEISTVVETDTYRFGDLYRSERGTTAEACAQMCNGEQACASWSLTPATFKLGPRCELKKSPGRMSFRPGAVSGISETWQMSATRDAAMLYQPQQPTLSEVSTRVYLAPVDPQEPELLGGPDPEPMVLVIPQPVAQPAPSPAPVAMPAPAAPQASLPSPASTVTVVSAPVRVQTQTPEPTPMATPKPAAQAPVVFKAPSAAPKITVDTRAVTAPPVYAAPVQRSEPHLLYKEPVRTPPVPNVVTAATVQAASGLQNPSPAAPPRVPWTERDGSAPIYSVGTGFIPGDEEASAGFVDGLPETDSEDR